MHFPLEGRQSTQWTPMLLRLARRYSAVFAGIKAEGCFNDVYCCVITYIHFVPFPAMLAGCRHTSIK